jgi:hypothetical protein
MPSPTYVALAKTVLTGTQAEITFSSIPSTYTDLLILASTRSNRVSTVGFVKIRFNGATADTNLTARFMYGGNSTVTSSTESYGQVGISDAANSGANTFASFEIYLPNYAGSTAKPISSTSASEDNSTSNTYIQATASLLNSTTAISSITLLLNNSDSFVSGSRFDLYGIKNS